MKSMLAAAALVATTAASTFHFGEVFSVDQPSAKVVNRCPYDVYLWSIEKEMGCSAEKAIKLTTGDVYRENFRQGFQVPGGVSIKLSKFNTCGGKDITQLEYKIESKSKQYEGNYLDMSFVDCTGNLEDCPGRTDGFYLRSGNQNGLFKSAANNEHCPIFNVYDAVEAAKVSYIKWDDPQTKFCNTEADLELYLCGGDAPSADDDFSDVPVPSSEIESSSNPLPTSSSSSSEEAVAPSTTEEPLIVEAAAEVTPAPSSPAVKTEVVYVTEYVERRHAHGRRHQHFHA